MRKKTYSKYSEMVVVKRIKLSFIKGELPLQHHTQSSREINSIEFITIFQTFFILLTQ